jgi:hypothetical protein
VKLTINAANVQSQLVGVNGEIMLDYSVDNYNLVIDAAGIITGGQSLISLFMKAKDAIDIEIVRAKMESSGLRAEADAIEAKIIAEREAEEAIARDVQEAKRLAERTERLLREKERADAFDAEIAAKFKTA